MVCMYVVRTCCVHHLLTISPSSYLPNREKLQTQILTCISAFIMAASIYHWPNRCNGFLIEKKHGFFGNILFTAHPLSPNIYILFNDMMTSSNENIFRVTGPLCGEFTGYRWIPLTKASDAKFDVFFDLSLNKRLSKQSWGWWFETPSRSLWRHFNEYVMLLCVRDQSNAQLEAARY